MILVDTSVWIKYFNGHSTPATGNYRHLRKRGVTVRKTLDVMIASFCLQNDHRLLHSDREHLGLRTA